ncbi:MAG: Ku protein [Fibrobacteres bacterium]|nr:Ku protein [Fibrobacterota bacterium]
MPTAWKGTISFGLVNIPITLYPAFKSRDLEFHLLHKEDHGRIGYQKVCKKCGRILAPDDIVKAFEHEKDSYVPMEKDELEEGKAPNTRNLEISLFVKDGEIDSKLYERPYYVMPAKKAENLYVLLREAIRGSGMVGVGKIQFGNKEHLAALKCDGPAIMLNLMHFMEEMEDPKSLDFPSLETAVGKKELDLAKQLVGTLKGHFQPEEFQNTHRARLEETIQEKVGREMAKSGSVAPKGGDGKIIDLMERLKLSLQKGAKGAMEGKGAKESKVSRVAKAAKAAKAVHADPEKHSEKHYHRKKAG